MAISAITFEMLPQRDYTRAAECSADLDVVADMLDTQPKLRTSRDGSVWPMRYRQIYLSLGTGKFAMLTQLEHTKDCFEIALELHRDRFFDEADLLQILSAFDIEEDKVTRIYNDFTWIPAGASDGGRKQE
jgi:hypothetical protein